LEKQTETCKAAGA